MLKRWNFLKTGFYEGIKDAFVESMGLTFAATAVMALAASILAYRFMPAHDIVPGSEPETPEEEPVPGGGLEAEPIPVRINE